MGIFTPYIALLVLIFGLFWQVTKTFYQQDEWLALGNITTYGWNYLFLSSPNFLQMILGEGRIASRVVTYFLLGAFPFNVIPLVIYGILLHTINTFLVYRLLSNFFKSVKYSLIGASFFAVNSVSHQAVTWPAAIVGTLTATTLLLLSLFTYFEFLGGFDSRKGSLLSTRWLVVTVVLIYISFHFKETGIFLVVFLPLATFFLRRELFFSKIKLFLGFVAPLLLFVFYKIIELRQGTTESNLFITGLQENFFSVILMRAVFYPLTSFSLMFVPGGHFLSFARLVMDLHYPYLARATNAILIAQSAILDFLAMIFTGFLVLLIYVLLKRERRYFRKIVVFWLAFSLMSFLPYIILSKDFSYLESRYYYLPVAGGAFLFSWVLKRIGESFGKRILFSIAMPLAIFYLFFHAGVVRGAIIEQIELGNLRRDLIVQLKRFVPTLDNEKNVFYISGDRDYWADGNKVPFQQGTGYTLMILYNSSGKIPKELLKEGFLFEIGSEGYREVGENGFGYFWNKEELAKVVNLHGLSSNSVVELYYNSGEQRFIRL